MESTETEWQNVMERGRVGSFIEVLCVCVYLYGHVYREKGYVESSSLRFNPWQSEVESFSCAEFPNWGLQSLRTQEAEMLQTGNAHRQWVCKVCLGETDPCVAITKSWVSATANERSHRMSVMKSKEAEIQKLFSGWCTLTRII